MNRLRDHGRAIWLIGALAATTALVGLTGCGAGPKANLERGELLFTQNCGSCHALTGAGTSSEVGPNLDFAFKQARANGMDSDTVEGVVKAQIQNPRPATPEQTEIYMPADLVSGQDLDDVAAYVASVAGVEGIEPPVFAPPEFFVTNCGGCHVLSQAGTTGAVGPNLDQVLPGQSVAQVSESIAQPEAKTTPGYPAGVMPASFGQSLTPEQLQSLSAYLQQAVGGGK